VRTAKHAGDLFMKDLKLPFLTADQPLEEGFRVLIGHDVSAVVVKDADDFRVLHLDDLRNARYKGARLLRDVTSYAPVLFPNPAPAAAPENVLNESGYRYILERLTADTAMLYSPLDMHTYTLSPPAIVRCTYSTVHYYPPHMRKPGQTTCSFDGTPLV